MYSYMSMSFFITLECKAVTHVATVSLAIAGMCGQHSSQSRVNMTSWCGLIDGTLLKTSEL